MIDMVTTYLCTRCNEYFEAWQMASVEKHLCADCAERHELEGEIVELTATVKKLEAALQAQRVSPPVVPEGVREAIEGVCAFALVMTYGMNPFDDNDPYRKYISLIRDWLSTLPAPTDAAPQGMDAPDGPGWYAFEGHMGRERQEYERTVAEVFADTSGALWAYMIYGCYNVSTMAGQWTRLSMPWESEAPDAAHP